VWLNQIRHANAQRRKPAAGLVSLTNRTPADSQPAPEPAATDPTPSENAREQEGRFLLERALEKLPDSSDREVVRLRFFEGLSFAQIGERLGRDESTIRSRLQRVLDFLGNELKAIS